MKKGLRHVLEVAPGREGQGGVRIAALMKKGLRLACA